MPDDPKLKQKKPPTLPWSVDAWLGKMLGQPADATRAPRRERVVDRRPRPVARSAEGRVTVGPPTARQRVMGTLQDVATGSGAAGTAASLFDLGEVFQLGHQARKVVSRRGEGAGALGVSAALAAIPLVGVPGKKKAGELLFREVDPADFERATAEFVAARPDEAGFLTLRNADEMRQEEMRTFLSADGKSGYALHPKSGDIRNVFNHGAKGMGQRGLAEGIYQLQQQGITPILDNFDTDLGKIYDDFGFEVRERFPWNDEYRPAQWNEAKHGRPDVTMRQYAGPTGSPAEILMAANAKRAARTAPPVQAPPAGTPGVPATAPQERIALAAVRTKDGRVFGGSMHSTARLFARTDDVEDGFVTNTGRFVSRDEAGEISAAAKQRAAGPGGGRDALGYLDQRGGSGYSPFDEGVTFKDGLVSPAPQKPAKALRGAARAARQGAENMRAREAAAPPVRRPPDEPLPPARPDPRGLPVDEPGGMPRLRNLNISAMVDRDFQSMWDSIEQVAANNLRDYGTVSYKADLDRVRAEGARRGMQAQELVEGRPTPRTVYAGAPTTAPARSVPRTEIEMRRQLNPYGLTPAERYYDAPIVRAFDADGKVIGSAEFDADGKVFSIRVDDKARRQGVGTSLLDAVRDHTGKAPTPGTSTTNDGAALFAAYGKPKDSAKAYGKPEDSAKAYGGAPAVITRDRFVPKSRVFDRSAPDIQGQMPSDPRLVTPGAKPKARQAPVSPFIDAVRNSLIVRAGLDEDAAAGLPLGGEGWYNFGPIYADLKARSKGMTFEEMQAMGAGASASNSVANELSAMSIANYARQNGLTRQEAVQAFLERTKSKRKAPFMAMHERLGAKAIDNGAFLPTDPFSGAYKIPSYWDKRMGGGGVLDINAPGAMPALDTHERRRIMQFVMDDPNLWDLAIESGAFELASKNKGVIPIRNSEEYKALAEMYVDGARRMGLPTSGAYQAGRWIGGAKQTGLKTQPKADFVQLLEDGLLYTAQQRGLDDSPKGLRNLWGDVVEGREFILPWYKEGPYPIR